tara:strand:+ start:10659 stop:12077 length:1419 start_codon:yes stop_codon:yes gene_type:complete
MIKKYFILFLAKQIKTLLRFFNVSGGTALPGLLVEKVYPKILDDIAANFSKKTIIISGTNGKTSTTNILSNIFENNEISVISNFSGSNLQRGVISAYLDSLNNFGQFISPKSILILEIDEGVLPQVAEKIKPEMIILLNLFRDQLDRYGEIENIRSRWMNTFAKDIFMKSKLIVNADDFLLSDIANSFQGEVSYFGIDDQLLSENTSNRITEISYCYCGNKIIHSLLYYAHIGKWQCSNCENTRKQPDIIATNIQLSNSGIRFNLKSNNDSRFFESSSIGLFSVYNAVAAFSALIKLGINLEYIHDAFKVNHQIFGRQESFIIKERKIKLFLVKNPAGLDQVIDALMQKKHINENQNQQKINLLFALNSRIEDGKDVSWIYDADFETLTSGVGNLVVSGERLHDLALRFVIAGASNFEVEQNIKKAISAIISKSEQGSDIYLLLTYSAMMEYRKYIAKISGRKPFWQMLANE